MEAIKLNTRLGNCELKISAQIQNDKISKLASYAMQFMVWHLLGSLAFNKKSDFKRDADYSDALAKHLVANGNDVLKECFSDISITTAKRVTESPLDKAIKTFVGLGFDAETAKQLAVDALAKLNKTETSTIEAVEEAA